MRLTASWYAARATLRLTLEGLLEVADCMPTTFCIAAQVWETQSALMDVPAGPGHEAQLNVCELQLLVPAELNQDRPQGVSTRSDGRWSPIKFG